MGDVVAGIGVAVELAAGVRVGVGAAVGVRVAVGIWVAADAGVGAGAVDAGRHAMKRIERMMKGKKNVGFMILVSSGAYSTTPSE